MSKFNWPGGKGKKRDSRDKPVRNYSSSQELSETIRCFKQYATELDQKHNKFERIVKLSRDITIESKRIIFLLHTIDRSSKKTSVLNEAETRLEALVSNQWKLVATELFNEDPYVFHRAFTAGMQEFLEAFIYYNYLKNEIFFHWDHYQEKLNYPSSNEDGSVLLESPAGQEQITLTTTLVPVDYILGLADTTGELMRKCINNLGEGDFDGCFMTCDFVRNVYSGFLTIGYFGNKEMSRKVFTLRQSLLKMEMVCYNIHVRGSEVPKHMLGDVESHKVYSEDDEGYLGEIN